MTQTTTHTTVLSQVIRFFEKAASGLFDVCGRIAETDQRLRRIRTLSAMSDQELAARGLRRENIIRDVLTPGC